MQLARFLNNVFKKDGFILVDANSKVTLLEIQKWKPIKVKFNKILHYKLLFHPDLYFGVGIYRRWNNHRKWNANWFLVSFFNEFGRGDLNFLVI